MKSGESIVEKSRNVEDLHELRLMALLHELVRKKGHKGTARVLGDHRAVAACITSALKEEGCPGGSGRRWRGGPEGASKMPG